MTVIQTPAFEILSLEKLDFTMESTCEIPKGMLPGGCGGRHEAKYCGVVNRCCETAPSTLLMCQLCKDIVLSEHLNTIAYVIMMCCGTRHSHLREVFTRIEPIK